jgi:hypothetical protein
VPVAMAVSCAGRIEHQRHRRWRSGAKLLTKDEADGPIKIQR